MSNKKGKIYFTKKFPALKMVMSPKKQWKDQLGNPKTKEGRYIQFAAGRFETDDPKEQAFIEDYMGKNQGDITIVDLEEVAYQKAIMAKAKLLVDQEREARGATLYGKTPKEPEILSDDSGHNQLSEVDKKVKDATDKLNAQHEKEKQKLQDKIDAINAKEEKKINAATDKIRKEHEAKMVKNADKIEANDVNQISKSDLLDLAKSFGVELTEAEQKDHQLCRKKVSHRIEDLTQRAIQEPTEPERPDLDDESEEDNE